MTWELIEPLGAVRGRASNLFSEPPEPSEIPSVPCQLARGSVIRVQVICVVAEHQLWGVLSNDRGEALTQGSSDHDAAVSRVEVVAHGQPEQLARCSGFSRAVL